jgi:hypothetical protein
VRLLLRFGRNRGLWSLVELRDDGGGLRDEIRTHLLVIGIGQFSGPVLEVEVLDRVVQALFLLGEVFPLPGIGGGSRAHLSVTSEHREQDEQHDAGCQSG